MRAGSRCTIVVPDVRGPILSICRFSKGALEQIVAAQEPVFRPHVFPTQNRFDAGFERSHRAGRKAPGFPQRIEQGLFLLQTIAVAASAVQIEDELQVGCVLGPGGQQHRVLDRARH